MIDRDSVCPDNLPPAIWEGLRAHALDRRPTGHFVTAVLTNDLRGALGKADEDSLAAIRDIVRYCYWELPGNCWGSVSKVNEWLNEREECA
jgi:hypothetical protein